ncbi:hypothetical protein AB0K05_11765 [Nonomuraea sp. NPDC049486]|uniref:hypothetical protein n=1 Tax=Nonomuraea sp. NPDC049486 TaxID=3155773 RepID=UPI00342D91F7
MNNRETELAIEPELDSRLRRTLSEVAMTIGDIDEPQAVPLPRRRRFAWALGTVMISAPLLGFTYVQIGAEYVDRLPTENALFQGRSGPDQYWLVPSFHQDGCGKPMPGVELVSKRRNIIGAEWDTVIVTYSKANEDAKGCFTASPQSASPDQADIAVTRLGPGDDHTTGWIVFGAFHPSVHTVRVTARDAATRTVTTLPRTDDPDGPRYAALTMPASVTQATITLLDSHGSAVPGGVRHFQLHTPDE